MSSNDSRYAVVLAVGDIMLGDSLIKIGHGVRSELNRADEQDLFSDVKSTLNSGDIIFGNLEAVTSDINVGKDVDSRSYRASPKLVPILRDAGFSILNIANNHIMQHGLDAFIETIQLLVEHGIEPLGYCPSQNWQKPVIFEVNSLKIGFLGYSLHHEHFEEVPHYCIGDKEKIISDIDHYKDQVNCMIISLHWGDEYIDRPSPEQVKLAREIIDAGANLILGHHPHMVQGVERYHDGLIAYSLGNFVFDQDLSSLRKTFILKIILNNDTIDFETIPVWIDDHHRPNLNRGIEKIKFLNYFQRLSEKLIQEDLSGFEGKSIDYIMHVKNVSNKYKSGLKVYFLLNLYKYSIRDSISLLRRYITKRYGADT